jgi:hypothetical protein
MVVNVTIIDAPGFVGRAGLTRRFVLLGLIAAFVLAAVVALWPYEVSKECKGGAFSAGFGTGFDAQRCDVVFRFGRAGREIRLRLPDVLHLCCPPQRQACRGTRMTLTGAGC